MKIPETSANVGAYYGNEENGQWQPNGVIMDSGVGGGVVGSGDAGLHRAPIYPVHVPRSHIPGYHLVPGAFYPPAPYPPVGPAPQDDFADYMWMENEEEFDKQVMQQLEEEALMEQCIEAMLEDEQRERNQRPMANGHHQHHHPTTSNCSKPLSLEETVSRSTLNPLAAEFVPTRRRQITTTEDKLDPPEVTVDVSQKTEEKDMDTVEQNGTIENTQPTPEQRKMEETPTPPPTETPEVSAADIQTEKVDKRPKDTKKEIIKPKVDTKKVVKQEVKVKSKPQPAKSETKVQPKPRRDLKTAKSDNNIDEKVDEIIVPIVIDAPKQQPQLVEELQTVSTEIKPINYAAAAKANKPKKPTTPPAVDKNTPPPQIKTEKTKTIDKIEKKEKTPLSKDKLKTDKPALKTDKVNAPRKNSAK